jgi:hypothetical protein
MMATMTYFSLVVLAFCVHHSVTRTDNNNNTLAQRLLRASSDTTALVLQHEHDVAYSDLRYIAFGTSRTWGSGLKDRQKAFPFLLSPNATNLAIRAADATTPSLCTVSMIGDTTMADVIIMEYNLQANKALVRLAKRVRQRFPKAVIIFLKVWLPWQFFNVVLKQSPSDMLKEAGWETAENYSYERLMQLMDKTKASDWRFLEGAGEFIEEARRSVDGIIFELPRPDNALVAVRQYGRLFTPDLTHYTEEGHAYMKNAIVNILRQTNTERHDDVNPWANLDVCRSWFETGKDKNGNSPVHHADMVMVKFGQSKYALEARSPHHNWIAIDNPSTKTLEVHIEYMVTDHPTIYPDVRITLLNSTDKPHGVPVKPEADIHGLKNHLHIVRSTNLGLAPPGTSVVHIATISPAKQHPFRVIGTILSPPESDVV